MMAKSLLLGLSIVLCGGLIGCTGTNRWSKSDGSFSDQQRRQREAEARLAAAEADAQRSKLLANDYQQLLQKQQQMHAVVQERIENLKQANHDLQADLTGVVMNAAAEETPLPMLRLVGAQQAAGFAIPAELQERLNRLATKYEGVYFVPAERVCRFESARLFSDGGDQLRPQGREVLKELAGILNDRAAAGLNFLVVGHVAKAGVDRNLLAQHPTDWHLGAHQAIALEQQLEEFGLSPVRVGVVSYGSQQPLVNAAGAAANARVELFFLPPDPPKQPPMR